MESDFLAQARLYAEAVREIEKITGKDVESIGVQEDELERIAFYHDPFLNRKQTGEDSTPERQTRRLA